MTPKKIETYGDLPEYGKYVLISGINKRTYGKENGMFVK